MSLFCCLSCPNKYGIKSVPFRFCIRHPECQGELSSAQERDNLGCNDSEAEGSHETETLQKRLNTCNAIPSANKRSACSSAFLYFMLLCSFAFYTFRFQESMMHHISKIQKTNHSSSLCLIQAQYILERLLFVSCI